MEIKYVFNKQLTVFSDQERHCENFLPADIFSKADCPMKLLGGPGAQNHYLNFLVEMSSKAKDVRGCVAYWTIEHSTLPELFELLKGNDSFICVDPSPPTELNMLAAYHTQGYHFWAFGYYIKNFETKDGLLHSKILLFDLDEKNAILLLGSHNMTNRALSGINIEHSIGIPLIRGSESYHQIDQHLRCIKEKYCIPPWNRQEKEEEALVMTIIGEDMANLVAEKIITVFFKLKTDGIKTTGKKVYVLALDVNSKDEYLYVAEIHQAGELNKQIEKSTGIDFSRRRIAETEPYFIPYLFKEKAVERKSIEQTGFFNNLRILRKLEGFEIYESGKVVGGNNNVSDFVYPLTPIVDGEPVKVFRYQEATFKSSSSLHNTVDFGKYSEFYSLPSNERNIKDKSLKALRQRTRKIATKKIVRFKQ